MSKITTSNICILREKTSMIFRNSAVSQWSRAVAESGFLPRRESAQSVGFCTTNLALITAILPKKTCRAATLWMDTSRDEATKLLCFECARLYYVFLWLLFTVFLNFSSVKELFDCAKTRFSELCFSIRHPVLIKQYFDPKAISVGGVEKSIARNVVEPHNNEPKHRPSCL